MRPSNVGNTIFNLISLQHGVDLVPPNIGGTRRTNTCQWSNGIRLVINVESGMRCVACVFRFCFVSYRASPVVRVT